MNVAGAARHVRPVRPTLAGIGARRRAGRLRRLLAGIRLRLVWWFIVVLAFATAASVILVREVLLERLDARIETDLEQEVAEIRGLAETNDPETGQPFGDRIDRIFEVFLERNIPAPHESMLTFLDGRPHLHSPRDELAPLNIHLARYPLHRDAALVARWSSLTEPERGRADTPDGAVEYLGVPFLADGTTAGVFVVAAFRDQLSADTHAAALAAAIVGLVALVIGSVLAVRLAERILAPVRLVTRTARSISETDLSRRIAVDGHDEISELATTFNEMLERLDAAFATQRRFTDDAGHELRTPITVIRGHLELLDDDPIERRRTLDLVTDELERMTRLVDDLLTLARAEQNDFLRIRAVELDDLTFRMLDNAQELGSRTWRLEAAASGRAAVDEQRLMQATLQLAENAVRHTADGEAVWLGSSASDTEVRFWVRDAGPGVRPGEDEQIFQRFYRGRSSPRRSSGAGLGLSIVRAIAEGHGGRVEVDSRPGRGATFCIVIPRIPDYAV